MRWLVLLAALLLSGCGGGGGHSNPPHVQPIPRHELLYCYGAIGMIPKTASGGHNL